MSRNTPVPVLPLVASTMVSPIFSRPSCSAFSMIPIASRSYEGWQNGLLLEAVYFWTKSRASQQIYLRALLLRRYLTVCLSLPLSLSRDWYGRPPENTPARANHWSALELQHCVPCRNAFGGNFVTEIKIP